MLLFLAVSKMFAGIGFFLLGMNYLEDALRRLAGRSFKIYLRKQSGSKFKAIAGGAIVTGVLQSSSVVNLMVLAFVGSNVITMQNALAIILGANIGTTLDSWIVASLGFSFNIEIFSLPLAGTAGIAMVLLNKTTKLYQWSKFLFGFAVLFVGLDFMKISFDEVIGQFDFFVLKNYPAIIFVLLGFVVTSIIQSSFATVAITLSALHVQAIGLYSATAIVLGSELGTTIKLLLASINGVPDKKRVALGNFIYNGIMIVLVLIALQPINYLITEILSFENPLLSLVFFQSFINVLGMIIFLPFLKHFEKFLLHRFKDDQSGSFYLRSVSASDADLALDAFEKEVKRFIWCTIDFHLHAFEVKGSREPETDILAFHQRSFSGKYEYLKLLHGEIHSYSIALNKELLEKHEQERMEQLVSSVRNSMFSSKSIKDSLTDIEQLKNSSSAIKFSVYKKTQEEVKDFSDLVSEYLVSQKPLLFDEMVVLYKRVQAGYQSELNKLYQQQTSHQLTEVDISTLMNFNREFFASYKALVWAVKDYLLNKEKADYFEDLPGFIR